MSKNNNFENFLMAAWLLGELDDEHETAQELCDDWYSPEEIANELNMDEDEVREIVWDDNDDYDNDDYDNEDY